MKNSTNHRIGRRPTAAFCAICVAVSAVTASAFQGGDWFGGGDAVGGGFVPPPPPPAPIADSGSTARNVISSNGINAAVVLDGSRSIGMSLSYAWWESDLNNVDSEPALLAAGRAPITSCVLPIGTHQIILAVEQTLVYGDITSPGAFYLYDDYGFDIVEVEVITASTAVSRIAATLDATGSVIPNRQALLGTLNAASASFARGDSTAGLNQLAAFQNKIRGQMALPNPDLAASLIDAAQAVVAALQP